MVIIQEVIMELIQELMKVTHQMKKINNLMRMMILMNSMGTTSRTGSIL